MNRIAHAVPAVLIFAFALLFLSACSGDGISIGRRSVTVGSGVKPEDITEFYWTRASSTFPPEFQRYHFYVEDGKRFFRHEKREGDHFPLNENDVTVAGKKELTEDEWNTFFDYLSGGTVKDREEDVTSGDDGPWTYLYWTKDNGETQEFSFESYAKALAFEDFCIALKEQS